MNRLLVSAVALFVTLAGCGTRNSSKEANSAAFDSVRVSDYSGFTAVAVTHAVRDYDHWLEVYKDVSDPESRLSILASPDDPHLITVFELTKSHAAAKTEFDSDMIKKAMEEGGVTSEPVIRYYDIKFRTSESSDKTYRLGVSHEVEDFDRWKKIFDEDHHIRHKAELELRAISVDADNPNMVNIMFATNDIGKAKEVINSDELRKRMQEAGVRSEPVFTVYQVIPPHATR
jgi:hypothetical protein